MTMVGGSVGGVIVPSVKSEPPEPSTDRLASSPPPPPVSQDPSLQIPAPDSAVATAEVDTRGNDREGAAAVDKDVLCPICMQIIKDAFLTSCGHNFCYMCIATHLQNKNDCPCCAQYLTTSQIFPNFLLNKMLMKASACQIAKVASPVEQVRLAFQQFVCYPPPISKPVPAEGFRFRLAGLMRSQSASIKDDGSSFSVNA